MSTLVMKQRVNVVAKEEKHEHIFESHSRCTVCFKTFQIIRAEESRKKIVKQYPDIFRKNK